MRKTNEVAEETDLLEQKIETQMSMIDRFNNQASLWYLQPTHTNVNVLSLSNTVNSCLGTIIKCILDQQRR